MTIIVSIVAGLVVYIGPTVLGAWVGTRARRAWLALLLAWIATPIAGLGLAFVIEIMLHPIVSALGLLHDPHSSGRGMLFLIMPIAGVFSGLPAGIVAAMIVAKREQSKSLPLAPGANASGSQ